MNQSIETPVPFGPSFEAVIGRAIRWLRENQDGAVSLVVEHNGSFAAVARTGRWVLAHTEAQAQEWADRFGEAATK